MKKNFNKLIVFSLLLLSLFIIKTKADDTTIVNGIKNRGAGSNLKNYSGIKIGTNVDSSYGFSLSGQKGTTVTFSGQVAIPSDIREAFANPSDGKGGSQCLNQSSVGGETLAAVGYSALYKNVGVYGNEIVDVKATVLDFKAAETEYNARFTDSSGNVVHASLMRFGAGLNLNADNVQYVKIKFEFLKQNGEPISVKGNTTYWDVDADQGVILHDNNKGIHIKNNNNTLKTSQISGSTYVFSDFDGDDKVEKNTDYAFSEIFEGTSITRTLTFSSYNTSENKWEHGSGFVVFSGDTVVPSEMPDPAKKVSKSVVKKGEEYTYTISQQINQSLPAYYYKSFKIEDTLENALEVSQANIGIKDSGGTDVSSNFDITVSGQKVTVAAKSSYISSSDFYGKTYYITIKTKIKTNANLDEYKSGNEYIIPNHATQTYTDSENNNKTKDTNIINVTYKNYTLTVNHIDKDTGRSVVENSTTTEIKEYGDSYQTNPLSNSTSPKLPAGYKLVGTPSNASGTITDNTTVIYEYQKWKGNVITKYIDTTTKEEISQRATQQKTYGEEYTTTKKEINDYEFVKDSGNTSGTFLIDADGGSITVVYEYKKKEAQLIVEYIEKGTNQKLSSDVTRTLTYGESYTTSSASDIPQNYTLISEPTNKSGIVSDETVTDGKIKVTYWYQKKDPNVNPKISKSGTSKINSINDKVSYNINYESTFTDVIGDATIKIVDKLPYKIDVAQSELNGGTYDDSAQTITWQETVPVNSYNNPKVTITKNISVLYKNIDATKETMTNEIEQTTVSGDKTIKTTGTHITEIDIKGKITVKYIEKGTNKDLTTPIETTDKVGKSYETQEKSFEGYKLVTKPETENYTYKVQDQTVVYEYEKIKLNVTTRVNGSGGTIEGDEVVEYGNDSTKDKIKIAAENGYVIDTIKINDEKIDIPENQTSMTISNFIKMTEDKLVEVSFAKKAVVKVPITNSNSQLILIGVFILGLLGLCGYRYLKENNIKLADIFNK